jgi:cyclophilin family peptidyl-prolyl cis-trans isomerase
LHVARAALLAALVLGLAACGGGSDQTTTTTDAAPAPTGGCTPAEAPAPKQDGGQKAPTKELAAGKTYALVVQTNCGSFTIELDPAQAPKTAASLVALAESGYFDGTTFHRVVPGFVIQGGDPTATGAGGPGYQTVDVPPPNAAYTKGVVAMAKAGNEAPGTSGSQFFVVTGADAGLPPEYAVVGKVTQGMDTVLKIDALGVGDGPPSQPVVIERVTVKRS